MATTHAFWGMVLALPVLAFSPEFAPIAVAAGFVGGLAPDSDLYSGHRKTLHFPVYASIVAGWRSWLRCFAIGDGGTRRRTRRGSTPRHD